MLFIEIERLFKKNLIWDDSYEMCWYEMAWEALRKENLLEDYSTFESTITQIRAFTLIMLYSEFCQVQYEEVCFYDFYISLEYSDVTDLSLAAIAGMRLDQEDVKEYIEAENFDRAVIDVAETMREEVFKALVKHIGKGSVSLLYASMVAANWNDIESEDEYAMEDETKEPDDVFDKYKQIIDRHAEEILNADDYNSAEAFEWISSGTYRLEEY